MKNFKGILLGIGSIALIITISVFGATEVHSENNSSQVDSVETTISQSLETAETEETSVSEESSYVEDSSETSQSRESEASSINESNSRENVQKNIAEKTLAEKKYVKIKTPDAILWEIINQEKKDTTLALYGKIVVAKSSVIVDEVEYFSLYDLEEQFLGYINVEDVLIIDKPEGIAVNFNKYVTTIKEELPVFKDFLGNELEDANVALGTTFFAKELFNHVDGTTYLSLYDGNDKWKGYVKKADVAIANGQQGVYQPFNKYVTITSKNYNLWNNFQWKLAKRSSEIFGQTFLAKGQYRHISGQTYYSIYDSKGNWHGYMNSGAGQVTDQPQGIYQGFNKYISITSKGYYTWNNFQWQERSHSSRIFGKTFYARGIYRHYSGASYYSMYDYAGVWQGYVNTGVGTVIDGPQGIYQTFNKYITITGANDNIWSNFNWTVKNNTSKILGKTYLAKGAYQHANGETYYSIYDGNNRWQGYIQKKSVAIVGGQQGLYQNFSKYVTVTRKNYNIWHNFNWQRKDTTTNVFGKTYLATGRYQHYNGSIYYSMYDRSGNWQGYVNASATTVAGGPQGIYQSFGKNVVISSKWYSLWSDFNWREKNKSSNLFGQSLTARGLYNHANGDVYYSLYDKTGVWQGYINKSATTLSNSDAERMKKVQMLLNKDYNSSNYGIYVLSLTDASSASINGNKAFTAASTGKIPALYYTQKMINENKLNPNRKYLYHDGINQMNTYSYMRGGAGILQSKPFGTYYSLDQIMNWTAKYSDNQGANFLGYYGANRFDATMRKEISSIIGRTWVSPFSISPKENALLMEAVYKQDGKVVSYLSNTVYDDQRIPKYLPVKVAHKIGDVGSYRHDIAIVYGKQPYVLSVMTQNYMSYETISKMSKSIYDIMK